MENENEDPDDLADSKLNKYKKCGIKVSKALLYHVFGHNAIKLYNQFSENILKPQIKSRNLNSNILQQTRNYFKDKANGFYSFVEKFRNKKEIFNSLISNDYKGVNFLCKALQSQSGDSSLLTNETNRHIITKNEETFRFHSLKSEKIQKVVRGHLSRIKFLLFFQEELRKKTLLKIIKIQTQVKRFLVNRNLKHILLLKEIINQRHLSTLSITNSFFIMTSVLKIKRILIAKYIITQRRESLIKIQSVYRTYKIKTQVKSLIKKEVDNYILTYPFFAKLVKLIVYINGNGMIEEKFYNFEFCKLREMHVLYIRTKEFKNGKYRVRLIVDGIVTCDGRFPHIEFSDGHYYNIISFSVNQEKVKHSLRESEANTRETIVMNDEIRVKSESCMESLVDNSLNSNEIENCYLKELRRESPFNKVDSDLKRNLENKEARSYVDIIKQLVVKEFNNVYYDDFDNIYD